MKKNLLKILLSTFIIPTHAQDCSDLFISEYVEGPGNNNAIEIYNPTNNTIDLSSYTINRYSNGASSGPEIFNLSGSITSGEAIVVGNGQLDSVWVSTYWSLPVDPIFYSSLDIHCNGDYDANSTFYFNGDDAMTLEKNGDIIDVFGKVGEDPGSAWTDDVTAGYTDANGGTWWTKRQTLIRKSSVLKGVQQNPILFNATLEWDSLPDATYLLLGDHDCACLNTSLNQERSDLSIIYPNPIQQNENIIINTTHNIDYIEILNLNGERISIVKSKSFLLNNLSKGIYLVRVVLKNGKYLKEKLIIE
tara:strand:- start:42 stop:956 length:915 start_codon:yes stop_codon:yes gene_type:complete